MRSFAKIVNGQKQLTDVVKYYIIDVAGIG